MKRLSQAPSTSLVSKRPLSVNSVYSDLRLRSTGAGFPGPGTSPPLLDHYQCYFANGPSVDAVVLLADQFQSFTTTVTSPAFFCNPVDKNGEGIQDPSLHYTCYELSPLPFLPSLPNIPFRNQFGDDTLDSDGAMGVYELCVPSTKDAVN